MELFEALISLLVVGLAVYFKAKKKEKKKDANMTAWEGTEVPDQQPMAVQPVFQAAAARPAVHPLQGIMHFVQEKKTEPFPMNSEKMSSTITFPEGVDPCHDELYGDETEQQAAPEMRNTEVSPVAQEIVRGFVLGEILNKPGWMKYSRK